MGVRTQFCSATDKTKLTILAEIVGGALTAEEFGKSDEVVAATKLLDFIAKEIERLEGKN